MKIFIRASTMATRSTSSQLAKSIQRTATRIALRKGLRGWTIFNLSSPYKDWFFNFVSLRISSWVKPEFRVSRHPACNTTSKT